MAAPLPIDKFVPPAEPVPVVSEIRSIVRWENG